MIFDYLPHLVTYIISINAVTFLAFFWDKYKAIKGRWRIREDTLLLLAFLGGSPAAKWAQFSLRHKTKKQPFANILSIIFKAHIAAIALCGFVYLGATTNAFHALGIFEGTHY